jgi:hypothetical protein
MRKAFKEQLEQADPATLEGYAREKGIQLPNPACKHDVIKALDKHLSDAMLQADLFRRINRLEARDMMIRGEQTLKDAIGVMIQSRLPQRQGAVDGNNDSNDINNIIEALEQKVDQDDFEGQKKDIINLDNGLRAKIDMAALKQELDSVATTFEKRLEDDRGNVKSRIDDSGKRIDDVGKQVQFFQWVFGSLGVIITSFLAIAAVIGGLQQADFHKTKSQVEDLQRDLAKANEAETRLLDEGKRRVDQLQKDVAEKTKAEQDLFNSQCELFLDAIIPNCERNLEGLSLTSFDPEAFKLIERDQRILKDLANKATQMSLESDETVMLAVLEKINNHLLLYQKLLEAESKSERERALEPLTKAWDEPLMRGTLKSDRYVPFTTTRLDAYRLNVRGIIELQRYLVKRGGAGDALDTRPVSDEEELALDQAEELFNRAIAAEKRFVRPYSNLSVLRDYRFHALKPENRTKEALLKAFDTALSDLEKANKYPCTDRARSIIDNNRGHWHFTKCAWYLEQVEKRRGPDNKNFDAVIKEYKKQIDDALKDAHGFLEEAIARRYRTPTAFITAVDLECCRITWELMQNHVNDKEEKERLFNKVIADIKFGVSEGYHGYEVTPRAEFLARYPHYRILENCGPKDWEDILYKAAHVGARVKQ